MLKHLDLFSGIGGFTLACQWAGIETVCFVEIDKYCQKVLRKRFPSVPIVEDIRDVEKIKEIVAHANERGHAPIIGEALSQREDKTKPDTQSSCRSKSRDAVCGNDFESRDQPAILITAGFPCQPFSVAGKREGERDDRYLWPETLSVIEAINPKWVLLENVTGIINLALDTVLSDMEGAGYSYETLIIPACAVNAWHRRDRIWVVAYSTRERLHNEANKSELASTRSSKLLPFKSRDTEDVAIPQSRQSRKQTEQEGREDFGRGSQEVSIANTTVNGSKTGIPRQVKGQEGNTGEFVNGNKNVADTRLFGQTKRQLQAAGIEQCDWWAVESELGGMVNGLPCGMDGYFDSEPDIPRVAKGIKNRVDRLKCLGNAIVPQVAYEIIKVIVSIDNE